MKHRTVRVPVEDDGRTLARVLHDRADLPHAAARGLVASRCVVRNGQVVSDPAERVKAGDRIELNYDPGTRYRVPRRPRTPPGCRIVLEDADLVIVDKDPGVATVPVPSAKARSVEEILADHYRRLGHREPFVRAVHRIDRYTSGLVAFARNPVAFSRLRAQFRSRTPERVYLAIAEGNPADDVGLLRHRLAEHPASLKIHPVAAGGLRAVSEYRVLERFDHACLLEVRLVTGRRNQIRVQLAAEGHPLVGDRSYGRASDTIPRPALHARRLAFDHPVRRGRIDLESRTPADFRRLLRGLRRGERP